MQPECHCIIKHATSWEEVDAMQERLWEQRAAGDVRGSMLTIFQMQGCPPKPVGGRNGK